VADRILLVIRQFSVITTLLALTAGSKADTLAVDSLVDLQFQSVVVEPTISTELGTHVSVTGTLSLESSRWNEAGISGLEELSVRYGTDSITAWLGTFHPQFGVAWDQGSGVFESPASAYEGPSLVVLAEQCDSLTQARGAGASRCDVDVVAPR